MREDASKTAKLPFPEFPQNARNLVDHIEEIATLFEQHKHPSRVSENEEKKVFQVLVTTGGLRFLSWCFEHEAEVKGRPEQLALAGLSNQEQEKLTKFLKSHKAWSDFCLRSYRWSEGYYNEMTEMTYRHFIIAKTGRMATYLRFHSFDKMLECQTEYRVLAMHIHGLLEVLETGLRYTDEIDASLGKKLALDDSVSKLKDAATKLAGEIESRQKRPGPTKK